jgi:hypothetical protein
VSEGSSGDPEEARVTTLMARALDGSVTPEEREELALYAEQDPQVLARLEDAEQQGRLAHGWLARVKADTEIERVERGAAARIERGLGLLLLAAGYPLALWLPVLGVSALGAGFAVLLYSFVRVRMATHAKDPYKDVVR